MVSPGYIIGQLDLPSGRVPRITTGWSLTDKWDTVKVRWSIGRMKYRVAPGLYAAGNPTADNYVLATSNYKLSFDHLRRALAGMDAWILVLDTKGINVWCAAGKGTFGTKEVVRRIRIHHLDQVVAHRKLIIPQLGATGVAAHEVKRMTGFSVIYGPVKASDIRGFIDAGMKADEAMRRITFDLAERLKVIPVDIFYGKQYLWIVPAFLMVLSGFCPEGYSLDLLVSSGWKTVINLYTGYLSGCVVTPILLPWIPFRRFSIKGLLTGIVMAGFLTLFGSTGSNLPEILSWFLMIGGVSSFMAMNFTGSSTFTSLSGVQKEMKQSLPLQIAMAAVGLAGWILTRFISL